MPKFTLAKNYAVDEASIANLFAIAEAVFVRTPEKLVSFTIIYDAAARRLRVDIEADQTTLDLLTSTEG
jgi:hypothetical protein